MERQCEPILVVAESEERDHRADGEQEPEEHLVRLEISAQSAAHARDDFVGHVAEEFAFLAGRFRVRPGMASCLACPFVRRVAVPVIRRLVRRISLLRNLLRPPQDRDDPLDGGAGHHAVAAALLVQQLGHPLLDPFEDLGAALAAAVVALQLAEVLSGERRGVGVQRERVAAQADPFYFFHTRLSVSMVSTSSLQAASISASCSRPLSVMT